MVTVTAIARRKEREDRGQHTGNRGAKCRRGEGNLQDGNEGSRMQMSSRLGGSDLSRWAESEERGGGEKELPAEEADVSDHMERTHTLLGKRSGIN